MRELFSSTSGLRAVRRFVRPFGPGLCMAFSGDGGFQWRPFIAVGHTGGRWPSGGGGCEGAKTSQRGPPVGRAEVGLFIWADTVEDVAGLPREIVEEPSMR